MLSLSVKKLVFSYSRMTHNQNNTLGWGLILHLLAKWCYYYWFTILYQLTILLSLCQLAQLRQIKKLIFYSKHMVLTNSLVPDLYLISAEEKHAFLSFSFIHFIHSAKGKQPSPAFSSILPTNFSYFHFFVSLTFGP